MTWSATQAKAKFSGVLDKVDSEGPQLVYRRKRAYLVTTPEQRDEYAAKTHVEQETFVSGWDALASSFGSTFELEIPKVRGTLRAMKF